MSQNSVQTRTDPAAAVRDESDSRQRDSRQISNLIEQLDRDLAETEKNASRRS